VSIRRLALTSTAMAAMAFLLAVLAPDLRGTAAALAHPQRTVDTEGTDALLLSAAGLAAWAFWAWGALGLALTAASAAPGLVGGAAGLLARVVLPAGARRSAALALGIGLGVAVPVLLGPPAGSDRPVLAAAVTSAVPDWPTADSPGVPDWPADQTSGTHVVVRGDCLWDIAAERLRASGHTASDAEIAGAVQLWWSANADVIGPDADVILPGQVLRPPDQP
jgi:hypothetical protein